MLKLFLLQVALLSTTTAAPAPCPSIFPPVFNDFDCPTCPDVYNWVATGNSTHYSVWYGSTSFAPWGVYEVRYPSFAMLQYNTGDIEPIASCSGPDNAVWFVGINGTQSLLNRAVDTFFLRIDLSTHAYTYYNAQITYAVDVTNMAAGSDNISIWDFINTDPPTPAGPAANYLVRFNLTDYTFLKFDLGQILVISICAGPDNAMWMTTTGDGSPGQTGDIRRIDAVTFAVTIFPVNVPGGPSDILIAGSSIWFLAFYTSLNNSINSMAMSAGHEVATYYFPLGLYDNGDESFVFGPDNALWTIGLINDAYSDYIPATVVRFDLACLNFSVYKDSNINNPTSLVLAPDQTIWMATDYPPPGADDNLFATQIVVLPPTQAPTTMPTGAPSPPCPFVSPPIFNDLNCSRCKDAYENWVATGSSSNYSVWFGSTFHLDRNWGVYEIRYPSFDIVEYRTGDFAPSAAGVGPDNAVWFVAINGSQFFDPGAGGVIETFFLRFDLSTHAYTYYNTGLPYALQITNIVAGPDNESVWSFISTDPPTPAGPGTVNMVRFNLTDHTFRKFNARANVNSICTGPDNAIWMAVQGDPTGEVRRIDTITFAVTVFPMDVPSGPVDILITGDTIWVIAIFSSINNSISSMALSAEHEVITYYFPSDFYYNSDVSFVLGPDNAIWIIGVANEPGNDDPPATVLRFDLTCHNFSYYQDPNLDNPVNLVLAPDQTIWMASDTTPPGGNPNLFAAQMIILPPTPTPTSTPTTSPSLSPTTQIPTTAPSAFPTSAPTGFPTTSPTFLPTAQPTHTPSTTPTVSPTPQPTLLPTLRPTSLPTTLTPTLLPSTVPTTPFPTNNPTIAPSASPTATPTVAPTPVHLLVSAEEYYGYNCSASANQTMADITSDILYCSGLLEQCGAVLVDCLITVNISCDCADPLPYRGDGTCSSGEAQLAALECCNVTPSPTPFPSLSPTISRAPTISPAPSVSPTALPTPTPTSFEQASCTESGAIDLLALDLQLLYDTYDSCVPYDCMNLDSLGNCIQSTQPVIGQPDVSFFYDQFALAQPDVFPGDPCSLSVDTWDHTMNCACMGTDCLYPPTNSPTGSPSVSLAPTTLRPTETPTISPAPTTLSPSTKPTPSPTNSPSISPAPTTLNPSTTPTPSPTTGPSISPGPTVLSSPSPTSSPTISLSPTTTLPSPSPTSKPTTSPTATPTFLPSTPTTPSPSLGPSSRSPSISPSTTSPTGNPAISPTPSLPTPFPTTTVTPTLYPSTSPTSTTARPTISPTVGPTTSPSVSPAPSTLGPSTSPTITPIPTQRPNTLNPTTTSPSTHPTTPTPSNTPTRNPSHSPTTQHPTLTPSINPTTMPTTPFPSPAPTPSPSSTTPTTPTPTSQPAPPSADDSPPTNGPSTSPSLESLSNSAADSAFAFSSVPIPSTKTRNDIIIVASSSVGGILLLLVFLKCCCPSSAVASATASSARSKYQRVSKREKGGY